jgi:hypothetical protein
MVRNLSWFFDGFLDLEGDLAMKGKRFSVEQIVAVLKQVELGLPVQDARNHTKKRRSMGSQTVS